MTDDTRKLKTPYAIPTQYVTGTTPAVLSLPSRMAEDIGRWYCAQHRCRFREARETGVWFDKMLPGKGLFTTGLKKWDDVLRELKAEFEKERCP